MVVKFTFWNFADKTTRGYKKSFFILQEDWFRILEEFKIRGVDNQVCKFITGAHKEIWYTKRKIEQKKVKVLLEERLKRENFLLVSEQYY
jgi:hypothetical protein